MNNLPNLEELLKNGCPLEEEWLEYVHGTVKGKRLEAMEEHLATRCAACVAAHEDAQIFAASMDAQATSSQVEQEYEAFQKRFGLAGPVPAIPTTPATPAAPATPSGRPANWLGLAAGLLLAASIGFWAYRNQVEAAAAQERLAMQLQQERTLIARLQQAVRGPSITAASVTDLYSDAVLRSGTTPSEAVLPSATAQTVLLNLGEANRPGPWQVELFNSRDALLTKATNLTAQQATLPLVLQRLEPGRYKVVASQAALRKSYFFTIR